MNEKQRLELGRYFDGELSDGERDRVDGSLAAEPEPVRYLERLQLLRDLAGRYDPSATMPSSTPFVVRRKQAATRRRLAVRITVVAAAAAALLALLCYPSVLRKSQKPIATVASQAESSDEAPNPVEATSSVAHIAATLSPQSPPLEFDAQCIAWANGEISSPASAARIVLDSQPRHGSRRSNAEILAIELAHAQPESMRQVTRTLVERSVSIRQPVMPLRAGQKVPAAPPGTPQGWFLDRGWRGRNSDPRCEDILRPTDARSIVGVFA